MESANDNCYTQIVYHVVLTTYGRNDTMLNEDEQRKLYAYIFGIITNKNCKVWRIGGVANHLHIVFELNTQISLDTLMDTVKTYTEKFVRTSGIFNGLNFKWQSGYCAFTAGKKDLDVLIAYVKDQKKHHAYKSLNDEIKILNV